MSHMRIQLLIHDQPKKATTRGDWKTFPFPRCVIRSCGAKKKWGMVLTFGTTILLDWWWLMTTIPWKGDKQLELSNYDTGCFKAYIPAGESEEDHPKSYFHHRQLKKNSSEQQIPYIFKIQILVGSCLCEYLWDTRVFSTFCLMWCGW